MDTRNMKRIVDCLSPRDSLGFWGLESIANELGMFDVAKDCADIGKKLFEISGRILDLTRERDAIIDDAARIRPMLLVEIERLRAAWEES